jgi:glycosyltransferase involved in cell wall biosynthesis
MREINTRFERGDIPVDNEKKLSIIVPLYNEEATIGTLYSRINNHSESISLEYVFIDDGSRDRTLYEVQKLAKIDNRIKYISFTRNFGKEAAMLAGLQNASGDIVSIIDADLQDPPEMLFHMAEELLNSDKYDCIAAKRGDRKGEPIIRSFFSSCFYKVFNKISDIEIVEGARDFRVMKRNMVNSILQFSEKNRFSKGIFEWVGYETKWVEYENVTRIAGKSAWNFRSLLRYSFEGIISFSIAPLQFISAIGLVMCAISALLIIAIVISVLVNGGDPVEGRPTLLCVIFFMGGIQLLSMGIVGQYIGKIYNEVKRRPDYIVKNSNIFSTDDTDR